MKRVVQRIDESLVGTAILLRTTAALGVPPFDLADAPNFASRLKQAGIDANDLSRRPIKPGASPFYRFAAVSDLDRGACGDVVRSEAVRAAAALHLCDHTGRRGTFFFEDRIADLPTGHRFPPDPAGWAMYGWLLRECGQNAEASQWLQRAREELSHPIYMKEGSARPLRAGSDRGATFAGDDGSRQDSVNVSDEPRFAP